MAVTLVQTPVLSAHGITLSTTPTSLTIPAATGGSTMIVLVCTNIATVTIGVNDLTNGAYTQAVYNDNPGNSGSASIWYKHGVTGGFTGVRVTASPTDTFSKIGVFEVAGVSAVAPTTGSSDNPDTNTHPGSASGLSGTGIAILCAMMSGSPANTPATDFIRISTDATEFVMHYKIGTLSSANGAYGTASNTNSSGTLALFAEADLGLSLNLAEPVIFSSSF